MSAARPSGPHWPLRLALVAAVLGGAVWGAVQYFRPTAQVVAVIRDKAVRAVPGTVEVKAEYVVELKSEVKGRVQSSSLAIGKHVEKGEVLAQIDTGDVDIDIQQIKVELDAARHKLAVGSLLIGDEKNAADSIADHERQVKLGAMAAGDLEKEKRLYEKIVQNRKLDEINLKLAVDELEAKLKAKERERDKMTITTPSDGVVTAVAARVGDLISPDSPIASLIAVGRTVEGKLSEDKFAAVRLGQKATVRFLTYGQDHYDATVSKILPAADPLTQRYTVYLDVKMPEGKVLTPGITGELFIVIAEHPNALLIPTRALVGDHVFVAHDGRLELRTVEKGYESLNLTEITSGLADGDQVVAEELDRFRDGERVRVQVLPK